MIKVNRLNCLSLNRRTYGINGFLYQTNLIYQPRIYWLREHLTKDLSIGNLKGVSFLSICCLSERCWRGMSLGALYNIESDEICFLFIVCIAWICDFFTVLQRPRSNLSKTQVCILISLPKAVN